MCHFLRQSLLWNIVVFLWTGASTWNLSVGDLWLRCNVLILNENLSELSQFSFWKFVIWTWKHFFVEFHGDCALPSRIFLSSTSLGYSKLCRAWELELSQVIRGFRGVLLHKARWDISVRQPWHMSALIPPPFLSCQFPNTSTFLPTPLLLTATLTVLRLSF